MANQGYSRKALMADKDISIKMTIFNALDQGDINRHQLVKIVAVNHGAQLSMDDEDFKNAQLHYSGVCRFVRSTLMRIQRESRS